MFFVVILNLNVQYLYFDKSQESIAFQICEFLVLISYHTPTAGGRGQEILIQLSYFVLYDKKYFV